MATEIASSPEFITIVTNVGVFLAAAGTVALSIWQAVKKIRTAMPADQPTTGKIVGGMIVDHTAMLMWSESNRTVGEKLDDVRDEMRELRFAITQLKDKM